MNEVITPDESGLLQAVPRKQRGAMVGHRWYAITLTCLILGFTGLYSLYTERAVPPWDPSSMAILGQAMANRHSIQYYDSANAQIGPYFNPHGFNIRAPSDPQPYSTFPPGLALFLALGYQLGGLALLPWIPPIFGALGLVAAAYLGYALGGRWASLLAVLLIGTSRVCMTFMTSLWSDGPSLSLLLVALAVYVIAQVRSRRALFLISGLIFGLFIAFKFVNVVFVALVGTHLLLTLRGRDRWADLACFGAGVLPGFAGMLAYQARAYGGPLASAYGAWGQTLYSFPLFSPAYLIRQAPAPWNDIASQAVALGLWRDMSVWIMLAMAGLLWTRRNRCGLLLALVGGANAVLYAMSVFTPRQFINMRYMLPTLAAGYLFVAAGLAEIIGRLRALPAQIGVAVLAGVICLGTLVGLTLPDLQTRNLETVGTIDRVIETARALPTGSVVLAYGLADSFILYGGRSVLNYRRISAPDLQTRNQAVIGGVQKLLCTGQPVYLVQDDETLFNTIYPELAQRFLLDRTDTPLVTYRVSLSSGARCPTGESSD